ncbi:MAG: ATP-binding cassette domain-containing protein, partial [Muribaculaceae bacterium]|nr:ATP-binding cassette domain-containing protein [Muribaculaceae bacterium]
MIEVKNVRKSFDRLEVLKGVSLSVNDGEIVSIVGPSGAGKSTLLQIMGSLDRPDMGEVCFNGSSIFKLSANEMAKFRNRNIGFVFQFHR